MIDISAISRTILRMAMEKITPAIIPHHLKRNTFGMLDCDDPRYVQPEMIYLDSLSGELTVMDDEVLDPKSVRPKRLMGRVGVMRVAIFEKTEMVTGLVADLSWISSSNYFEEAYSRAMPDDQEEANYWLERQPHIVPIAAIAFADDRGPQGIETSGDERFQAAARHLAEQARALDLVLKASRKPQTPPAKPTFAKRLAQYLR